MGPRCWLGVVCPGAEGGQKSIGSHLNLSVAPSLQRSHVKALLATLFTRVKHPSATSVQQSCLFLARVDLAPSD